MNQTRQNIDLSIDRLRATLLRARASHESTQQLLFDTRLHICTLQRQLRDLQQQVNALQTQQDTAVHSQAY